MAVGSQECDLTQAAALMPYRTSYDRIYHLAAWTQAGDFCLHHPAEQWEINQLINTHLVSWWMREQPQAKLIALGTSCGYDPSLPLSEEYYLLGCPIDSLLTYGMTKRMLYIGLEAARQQYGLDFLYLIPSTLYGPHYHTDERQPHFIFDLIRKIVQAQRGGSPVTLWGDGHQKRELIHVRDFVRILLALESHSGIYNIGAGQEHSIREFATLICNHVGYPEEQIAYDTTRYVGARSKVLSIAKLRAWELAPQLSLEEGLAETIAWYATTHRESGASVGVQC